MDPGSLSQEKLMRAIELVGMRVVPALCEELDRNKSRKEVVVWAISRMEADEIFQGLPL
jgi:hypothetical protein